MKVWLASFPRSGNTFLRNILFDVYGLESATYHEHEDHVKDADWQKFPVIKTHLLPSEVPGLEASTPVIYIIRDGRDSMCSLAHFRKDIVAPGSDYYENLKAAVIAEKGSFFGGWSVNALAWAKRADLIIRYEDLLKDQVTQLKRVEELLNLPPGDYAKSRSFEDLKFGIPKYGGGLDHGYNEEKIRSLSKRNFRKGKSGSWKSEMPEELANLFWSIYGETMEQFGYSKHGEVFEHNYVELDYNIAEKLGWKLPQYAKPMRVLLEADKLRDERNDGIKRYVLELVQGMEQATLRKNGKWQIDLFIDNKIIPITQWRDFIKEQTKDAQKKAAVRTGGVILPYPIMVAKNLLFEALALLPKFIRESYNFGFNKLVVWRRNARLFKEYQLLVPEIKKYNLIHVSLPQHYFYFKRIRQQFITTVHDLSHIHFPHYHERGNIDNAKKGMSFIQRKRSHIIAVSKFTKQDLVKEMNFPEEQITTITEGVNRDLFRINPNQEDAKAVFERYGLPKDKPYLFSLSTLEPRKNLVNTIKAFNKLLKEMPHLDVNLVIAGKKGWKIEELFLIQAVEPNRVFFTGYVDEADLPILYHNALAVSYVSHFEGFGLPILEAMNCGTPVIYGYNSSQIEVAGKAGYPANPKDVDSIKSQMETAVTLHALRQIKTNASIAKSGEFSWRKTIIATLQAYEQTIQGEVQD